MRPLFLLLASVPLLFAAEPLALVPQPQRLDLGNGLYPLPAEMAVKMMTLDLRNEGAYLSKRLKEGLGISVTEKGEGSITLSISSRLPADGYSLHVSGSGITIEGQNPTGVFNGIQTLMQLLPPQVYGKAGTFPKNTNLPCLSIEDSPALPWRGLHLDCARHFMPKEFVMKLLDLMAMHKLNRLHWHLVDSEGWRLEIKKYPKLTQVGQDQPAWYPGEDPTDHSIKAKYHYGSFHGGGFYTQDDVREIVAHATKLHIEIMPEIEFPAHAMAMLTAYPEFSTTGKVPVVKSNHSPDLINVDEKSMNFLKDILDETMSLFPGKWIHFGGDEAPKGQWKESAFVQARIKELGLKSEDELQSWLFGQMAAHVAKKGKVAVGWEEITHGFLPEGAVVMPWLSMDTAAKVANSGHPVILCPVGPLYFDSYQTTDPTDNQALYKGPFTLKSVYEFNCDLKNVAAEKRGNIWGAQAQLWTELMTKPEHVEYQAFPRAAALAEALWSSKDRKDFRSFQQRLARHVARLDVMNVNYRKLEPAPPISWAPQSISPGRKDLVLEGPVGIELQAGTYEATPVYQGGAFGLWFDRIELVADGTVIASDAHRGFTGTHPKDAVYKLVLKTDVPKGKTVTLRAHADSHEGTDSTGEIGLRKVP